MQFNQALYDRSKMTFRRKVKSAGCSNNKRCLTQKNKDFIAFKIFFQNIEIFDEKFVMILFYVKFCYGCSHANSN